MYVCMYVYMSVKKSGLSIVGLKLNCTADCVLFRLLYPLYSLEFFTYPIASQRVDLKGN